MKKYLPTLLSSLLIVASLSIFSCNDNDEDNNPMSTNLFDKWWYASQGTADIYISSNGDFEQHSGNPADDSFFGNWTWVDEDNLTILVQYLPGQGGGQLLEVWVRFSNLTETSMAVEQSLTGEAGSYVGPFDYTLVK